MRSIRFPSDCVIAVTYLCNSRCVMCDLWKETRPPTVGLNDYHKLPLSLRDINISGGEPFLHPQITEIVRTLRQTCPKARLTISTNGFLSDLIAKRVREIVAFYSRLGVRISIDGIGEAHERIRRIPQAFEKALATLRTLKKIGVRDLGVAYTMSGGNVGEMVKVRDFAAAEGVDFTCAVAQSSDIYFGGKQNERRCVAPETVAAALDDVICGQLKLWRQKQWLRAYFTHGLKRLALEGAQLLPSRAGEDFFFLDPFGNVYPSVVHSAPMGNIREAARFTVLWSSEAAQAARLSVSEASPYWMICTARTAIRRHLFRVAAWIIRRKIGTIFS